MNEENDLLEIEDKEKEAEEEVKEAEGEVEELAAEPEEEVAEEEVEVPEETHDEVEEKMLTQSQVNAIAAKARQEGRDAAMKEILERYGVGEETEMNDVFGKGQAYDTLNDEYAQMGASYKDVMAENALLKTKVDMNRWEDIKLILGGKGLEVTVENIEAELPSHPEWKGLENRNPEVIKEPETKPATLRKLGSDVTPPVDETLAEEERVRKMFGL